jgi:hypothetical protein
MCERTGTMAEAFICHHKIFMQNCLKQGVHCTYTYAAAECYNNMMFLMKIDGRQKKKRSEIN